VQTLTLYTPGAGKCGSMISAAFLGLLSLKRFREHATRQALQPEHLALSTNSLIIDYSFFIVTPTLPGTSVTMVFEVEWAGGQGLRLQHQMTAREIMFTLTN
jgi:hypothetical protein